MFSSFLTSNLKSQYLSDRLDYYFSYNPTLIIHHRCVWTNPLFMSLLFVLSLTFDTADYPVAGKKKKTSLNFFPGSGFSFVHSPAEHSLSPDHSNTILEAEDTIMAISLMTS